MSGQKWTKEPWVVNVIANAESTKAWIEVCHGTDGECVIDDVYEEEDADRIVACVNGCMGLNPEAFAECVKQLEYMTARCEEENMEDSITDLICAKAAIANARKVSA